MFEETVSKNLRPYFYHKKERCLILVILSLFNKVQLRGTPLPTHPIQKKEYWMLVARSSGGDTNNQRL